MDAITNVAFPTLESRRVSSTTFITDSMHDQPRSPALRNGTCNLPEEHSEPPIRIWQGLIWRLVLTIRHCGGTFLTSNTTRSSNPRFRHLDINLTSSVMYTGLTINLSTSEL